MKQLMGAAILLLGSALVGVLVLRIWGIPSVGRLLVLRSGATLLVLALALGALVVVWFAFFKNPAAGYDLRAGNRAHPKQALPPAE